MYCKKKKVKDKKQNAHIMFRNQLGSTTEKYASEKNGVCTHECEREIQNSPGKRKKYLGGCQEATAKNCGNLRNCARLKKKKKLFKSKNISSRKMMKPKCVGKFYASSEITTQSH